MRRPGAVFAPGVLLIVGWAGPPTTAGAATTGCTASDPAPEVLGITATDIVMQRRAVRSAEHSQSLRVTARFACGGGYEFLGCSYDPARPCALADIAMRRTASATSAAARRCGRFLNEFDDTTSSAPLQTATPDV